MNAQNNIYIGINAQNFKNVPNDNDDDDDDSPESQHQWNERVRRTRGWPGRGSGWPMPPGSKDFFIDLYLYICVMMIWFVVTWSVRFDLWWVRWVRWGPGQWGGSSWRRRRYEDRDTSPPTRSFLWYIDHLSCILVFRYPGGDDGYPSKRKQNSSSNCTGTQMIRPDFGPKVGVLGQKKLAAKHLIGSVRWLLFSQSLSLYWGHDSDEVENSEM